MTRTLGVWMLSPAGVFDLRAALSAELHAAIDELGASISKPQTVHRCRVHLKRARALARVGSAGAPGLASVFDDTARGVMRTLAPVRDVRALADTARKFRKKSRGKTAAAFEAMAQTLDAEAAARQPLDAQTAHTGLKDLLALALVWPEPSASQVRRGARRIAGKARRAFRRARGGAGEALRHDWRKREKDRLYAAELLGDAWPTRRRRKTGEKLGETLGREHDVCLLLTKMTAAPILANDERASERAARTLRKSCKRLARKADALGARLHLGKA